MTNRTNADFLQVLLRQAREDPFVYLVLAERSLILSKAKAPQPDHDVHDGGLTLPSTPVDRAFRQYLRGNAYEQRIRLALFRLDIDRVPIFVLCHLAQELLELAAASLAYTAFKLGQRFVHRLWLGE